VCFTPKGLAHKNRPESVPGIVEGLRLGGLWRRGAGTLSLPQRLWPRLGTVPGLVTAPARQRSGIKNPSARNAPDSVLGVCLRPIKSRPFSSRRDSPTIAQRFQRWVIMPKLLFVSVPEGRATGSRHQSEAAANQKHPKLPCFSFGYWLLAIWAACSKCPGLRATTRSTLKSGRPSSARPKYRGLLDLRLPMSHNPPSFPLESVLP
jgi:hypothetical protein